MLLEEDCNAEILNIRKFNFDNCSHCAKQCVLLSHVCYERGAEVGIHSSKKVTIEKFAIHFERSYTSKLSQRSSNPDIFKGTE